AVVPGAILRVVALLKAPVDLQLALAVQPDLHRNGRERHDGTDDSHDPEPDRPALVESHEDRCRAVGEEDEPVDATADRDHDARCSDGSGDQGRDEDRPGERLGGSEDPVKPGGGAEHRAPCPWGHTDRTPRGIAARTSRLRVDTTNVDAAALEKVLTSIEVRVGGAQRVALDAGGMTPLTS